MAASNLFASIDNDSTMSDDSFLQYKRNFENHIMKMPNIPVFKRAAIKRPLFPKKSPVVLRIRESPAFGAQLGKRALICSTPMDIYGPKLFVNEYADNSLIFSPVQPSSAHAKKLSKKYESGDLRVEKKRKKYTNSSLKSVMQQLIIAKNERKSMNNTRADQIPLNKSVFKERPVSANSNQSKDQLNSSKKSSDDSVDNIKTPVKEACLHKDNEGDNKNEKNGGTTAVNVSNAASTDDSAANKVKPLQNRRVTALVERQTQTTNSLEKLQTRSFYNLNNKQNTTTKRKLMDSQEREQLEVTSNKQADKENSVPVLNGQKELSPKRKDKNEQNKAAIEAKEKEINENEATHDEPDNVVNNDEINKSTQHLLNALDSKIYLGSVITISSESELTVGEQPSSNKNSEFNSPQCVEVESTLVPVKDKEENHKNDSIRKSNEKNNKSLRPKAVSTVVHETSTNKHNPIGKNKRNNNIRGVDITKEVRKTVSKIKDLKNDTFAKPQTKERKRKSIDDSVIKRETKAKNKTKPSTSRISKAAERKTLVQERASTFRMSGFVPMQIDEENSEDQTIAGIRKSTRGRRPPAAFIQSVFVGPTARGIIFSAVPSTAVGTFGKSRSTRSKSIRSRQSKMSYYKAKDSEIDQDEQPQGKQDDTSKADNVTKPSKIKKSVAAVDQKANKPTKESKVDAKLESKSKKKTKAGKKTSEVGNHTVDSSKSGSENSGVVETGSRMLRSRKVKNVEANVAVLQNNELEISRVGAAEIACTTLKKKGAKEEAKINDSLTATSANETGKQLKSKKNVTNADITSSKAKTNSKLSKNNSKSLEVSSVCEGFSMTLRSRRNQVNADITTNKSGASKLNNTKNNSKNSSKLIGAKQNLSNQNLSTLQESDVAKDNSDALELSKNVSSGSVTDKAPSPKTSVIDVNSDVNRSNGYVEESLEILDLERNVVEFSSNTADMEPQESFVPTDITVQQVMETSGHKRKTLFLNPVVLLDKPKQTNSASTTTGNRNSLTLDSGVSLSSIACNHKTTAHTNLHVVPPTNNNNNNSKLSRNSCKRSVTFNELPKTHDKMPDSPLSSDNEVVQCQTNENDFSKFHEEEDGESEKGSANVIHAVVNNEVVALNWLSDASNNKVSKTKAGISVRYKLHNLKAINGTISSGYLNIGPKQKTPIQIVKKHNIMFKVEEGRGLILIYGKKNLIEVGSVFYIPLGMQYSVVNLEKEQLTLFFTKIKVAP